MILSAELAKAKELKVAGKPDAAREILLGLLGHYPDNAEVAYQCAAVHDFLGLEAEAVPFYEKAIALGLANEDLAGATLGLGSTYRCLKDYEKSSAVLRDGVNRFPKDWGIKVFLAMTYHESGRHNEAMELLLNALAETSADPAIQKYKRAIAHYASEYGNKD